MMRLKYGLRGVGDCIDILTGTLGKALGGASGGYVSGRREVVALLRQRSCPYLFSNSLAPMIAAASLEALKLLQETDGAALRQRVIENTRFFRTQVQRRSFDVVAGEHPIVPIMFGDAPVAVKASERLLQEGIYVVAFSYPVVPMGKARIRVQMSAAHSRTDLERAIEAFERVRKA